MALKRLLVGLLAFVLAVTAPIQSANSFGTGKLGSGFGHLGALGKASVPAPSGLLLNNLSVPTAVAYSTRKLRSAYAGAALQVRRSSDSTTQDIGFASNNLDTASLATFCSGVTCTVTTWYDQSGNAVPANTGNVSQEPRIYFSGAVEVLNSHAALRYGLAATNAMEFVVALSQPVSIAIAAQHLTQVVSGHYTDGLNSSPRQLLGVGLGSPPTQYQIYSGSAAFGGGTLDLLSHDVVGIFNGASSSMIVDGVTVASGNSGSDGLGTQVIGAGNGSAPNASMNGFIGEYLVFNSVLGATDQATIRTSWQTYWGTQ